MADSNFFALPDETPKRTSPCPKQRKGEVVPFVTTQGQAMTYLAEPHRQKIPISPPPPPFGVKPPVNPPITPIWNTNPQMKDKNILILRQRLPKQERGNSPLARNGCGQKYTASICLPWTLGATPWTTVLSLKTHLVVFPCSWLFQWVA